MEISGYSAHLRLKNLVQTAEYFFIVGIVGFIFSHGFLLHMRVCSDIGPWYREMQLRVEKSGWKGAEEREF